MRLMILGDDRFILWLAEPQTAEVFRPDRYAFDRLPAGPEPSSCGYA